MVWVSVDSFTKPQNYPSVCKDGSLGLKLQVLYPWRKYAGLFTLRVDRSENHGHKKVWYLNDNAGAGELQAYSELDSNILMEQHRKKIANFTSQSRVITELKRIGADPMWLSCAFQKKKFHVLITWQLTLAFLIVVSLVSSRLLLS